ncbi:hypothetical protein DdX_19449 [Ditylenchus destructor]|uniref:Uncharacterized protein n=1 Tax=Ditylenchus destructor TaxID=166010 RepID=A0AAD4MJE7_9BILA|nr:hypothetical protein DdX_19449 [Ditylenchus destructor]
MRTRSGLNTGGLTPPQTATATTPQTAAERRRSKSPFPSTPTFAFYQDFENLNANCNLDRIVRELANHQPTAAAATALRAYLAIETTLRHITAPLAPISVWPQLPDEKLQVQLTGYKEGIAPQFPVVIANTGTNSEMIKLACTASSPLSADRTYCILDPGQTEIFFFGLHGEGYNPDKVDRKTQWQYRLHILRKRLEPTNPVIESYGGQTTRTAKASIAREYWNDNIKSPSGHAYLLVQLLSPAGDPPSRVLTWIDD